VAPDYKLEERMPYYCYLDSSSRVDSTNLQLYSLQQAANSWNDLIEAIEKSGVDEVDYLKERLAFILSCFGLSLSQLLGQNSPSPNKDKMEEPSVLLGSLLANSHVDRTTQRRLNSAFRDFLSYYGAVRHFGKNKYEQNYRTIDQLTVQELDRFRRMTIEIWDIVIAIYKQDNNNDLDEIRSISEVVWFDNLAGQSH
jgi:hypothetical protein